MFHLQSLGVSTSKSITDTSHSQDNTHSFGIGIAEDDERIGSRPYVDHTYHDFSHYFQEGGKPIRHKKADANFPAKLHQMLAKPQLSHIITWMPHGRTFKILNKELLITEATFTYFDHKKFPSFSRQLSSWGFKRLHKPGADYGCYYHECFLRDLTRLTWLMARVPVNQKGRRRPFAKGEPDFYQISKSHPVPTPKITLGHKDCTKPMPVRQAVTVSTTIPVSQSMPCSPDHDGSNCAESLSLLQQSYHDYAQKVHEGPEPKYFNDDMNAFIDKYLED